MYKYNKVNNIVDGTIGGITIVLLAFFAIITWCGKSIRCIIQNYNFWCTIAFLAICIIVLLALITTSKDRTLYEAVMLYTLSTLLSFIALGMLLFKLAEIGVINENSIVALWIGSLTILTVAITILKYIDSKQLKWEFSIFPQEGVALDKKIPVINSNIGELKIKARCNKKTSKIVFLGFCADSDEVTVAKKKEGYLSKICNPEYEEPLTMEDMPKFYKQLQVKNRFSYNSQFSTSFSINIDKITEDLSGKTRKNKKWLVFIDDFGELFGMPVKFNKVPNEAQNSEKDSEKQAETKKDNRKIKVIEITYEDNTKEKYEGSMTLK